MEWLTSVGIIVGIVGGATGIGIGVYTLLATRREKVRRVAVTLTWGLPFVLKPGTLLIAAANPGMRTVSLRSVGLLLPDGLQYILDQVAEGEVQLPHDLLEGRQCRMWVVAHQAAQDLKKAGYSGSVSLRGFYRDALGTVYKSRPLVFNIDQLAMQGG